MYIVMASKFLSRKWFDNLAPTTERKKKWGGRRIDFSQWQLFYWERVRCLCLFLDWLWLLRKRLCFPVSFNFLLAACTSEKVSQKRYIKHYVFAARDFSLSLLIRIECQLWLIWGTNIVTSDFSILMRCSSCCVKVTISTAIDAGTFSDSLTALKILYC